MADVTYVATLDDSQVLKALQNIDKNIDKLAQEADRDFKQVGQSAKASGIQIGAIAGAVQSVVTEIINLSKQAAQALYNIGEEAVTLAAKFEVNKGFIKNIFEGDEAAATAVIERLVKKGSQIGLLPEAAVGLGTSFLPDVESIDQLDRIIESAVKLKAIAPEKSIEDIRQALEQGLSGDALALQDRLNLPPEVRGRIKELQAEFGKTEGLLKALDEVFNKFGINIEDISDTAIGKFGEIQAKLQEIQLAGGEQALEGLKPVLQDIIDFLTTNREELILFAASLGDAVGSIAQFAAELSGLTDIQPGDITAFGQEIFNLVQQLELGVTIIGGWTQAAMSLLTTAMPLSGLFKGLGIDIEGFLSSLVGDQGILLGFLDWMAKSKAGLEGLVAILSTITESAILLGESLAALAAGDTVTAISKQAEAAATAGEAIANGQRVTQESYAESRKAFDEYNKAVDEQADAQENLKEKLNESTDAGTANADALLKQQAATRQAAKDAEKLAEAQDKVNKAMTEAAKDFQRKLEDIDIEAERKRLDIAIEFAQKREDAAKEHLRKIADLHEKYADDVADAQLDLERKEEDIARKFGQQRIDQERERREKQVEIERDYRTQLQDIQRQFLLDVGEAEEKRDAVAFIRALKERDKKVQDAQIDRNREIEELRISNEQKTEELRLQQQRELEEARIANERKLEDLKTNLDRQIEEQNENYAQQLDDLATAEQRKNEELNRWREREIEDAQKAYDRKLEDLRASLEAELALIEEYAARMAAAQASTGGTTNTTSSHSTSPSTTGGASAGFGLNPGTLSTSHSSTSSSNSNSTSRRSMGRRAGGGPVMRGRPYIVGERGPELFQPNESGRIVPNEALRLPNFNRGSNVITNNSTVNKNASLGGLLDANSLDSVLASKIENVLIRVLDKMS